MGRSFLKIAVVYVVVGAALGVYMGSTENFAEAPVHAHVMLLGWVTLALAGIVYHLYPAAAETALAKLHFWLHNIVLPPLMVSLAMVLTGNAALMPVVAGLSALMLLALAIFALNVLRRV
jgi:hypothetical protein